MANHQSSNGKGRKYFIPLELNEGTVLTREYENASRHYSKIGNRLVKSVLIPATQEQYEAYMRPLWREDKRQQRLNEKRKKREKAKMEHRFDESIKGWDTAVSYEKLSETGYGFPTEISQESTEEILEKEELLKALHAELSKLEDLDRNILNLFAEGYSETAIGQKLGLSQKGIHKRKKNLFFNLRKRLKYYLE